MRLDPVVSRIKFERELAKLRKHERDLQARGIHVLASSEFPRIDVMMVPRRTLQIAVPPSMAGGVELPPGAIALLEIPSLAARTFTARFDLTDYDLSAPSLEFIDSWTGQTLPFETMFRALEFESERKAHVVLLNDHPSTHKPFLCLRGIREYHEHPQHSGDSWMLYRNEMSLFAIVLSVWRVTIDLVQPQLLTHTRGVQINWAVEEKA
jgi:hypothetical protein